MCEHVNGRSGTTLQPDVEVTIVVPTYNESANIAALLQELDQVIARNALRADVCLVDDSTDDTAAVARRAALDLGVPVRVIHREQPHGGLSGAVVEGFHAAAGSHVVVMDGDLQHPPDRVPELVNALHDSDIVVASRYTAGGSLEGLAGPTRRFVSRGSTAMARALFPRRVWHCSDPMSGFFAVRRTVIDLPALRPRGYKILFEILARHTLRVREVPFTFRERLSGESKASLKEGLRFATQVLDLRLGRIGRFAGVGATGFVLNLALMAALLAVDVNYLLASVLATQVAIVNNFLLQERYVFRDRRDGVGWRGRFVRSLTFNNVEQLMRLPALVVLVEHLGANTLAAQACTLLAAAVLRYSYMSRVLYAPPVGAPHQRAVPAQGIAA